MKSLLDKWAFPRIDLAAIALMALGIVALYVLTVMPQHQRDQLQAQRGRELAARQNEAVKLSLQCRRTEKELANVRRELAASPVRLEPAAALNGRIAAVTRLASANRLKLEQVQPGEPTLAKGFSLVPINLTGSGAYRQWIDFLRCLPKEFPDTEIANFDLAGNPSESGSPTSFRVSLTWYALAPESAPTP